MEAVLPKAATCLSASRKRAERGAFPAGTLRFPRSNCPFRLFCGTSRNPLSSLLAETPMDGRPEEVMYIGEFRFSKKNGKKRKKRSFFEKPWNKRSLFLSKGVAITRQKRSRDEAPGASDPPDTPDGESPPVPVFEAVCIAGFFHEAVSRGMGECSFQRMIRVPAGRRPFRSVRHNAPS